MNELQEASFETQAMPKKRGKRIQWYWISIVCFLLFALVLTGTLFYCRNSKLSASMPLGPETRGLEYGMTQEEVTRILGNPDSILDQDDFPRYKGDYRYDNLEMFGVKGIGIVHFKATPFGKKMSRFDVYLKSEDADMEELYHRVNNSMLSYFDNEEGFEENPVTSYAYTKKGKEYLTYMSGLGTKKKSPSFSHGFSVRFMYSTEMKQLDISFQAM